MSIAIIIESTPGRVKEARTHFCIDASENFPIDISENEIRIKKTTLPSRTVWLFYERRLKRHVYSLSPLGFWWAYDTRMCPFSEVEALIVKSHYV